MVTYPIRVERTSYRGSDPKKRAKAAEYNRDAAMIEEHINNQIRCGKLGVFHYSTIAHEVRLDEKRVSKILFSVDCGHNGFTVVKGGESP
jgi:hypothetical protein